MDKVGGTIVALATPPGRGGVAVVRLSGVRAREIALACCATGGPLEARRATLARLRLEDVEDEVVVTWFEAPASYTGEDVVEVSAHGSPVIVARLVERAVREGARLAGAGEFTLRAFLNGRLDLAQAEAVQDLVAATTPAQVRMAFDQLRGGLSDRIGGFERELFELTARLEASVDFPEEGYHFIEPEAVLGTVRSLEGRMGALLREGRRGRLLREGATVAVVGRPNVGKSSVFNRLVGGERAIVTDVPGTTRDVLAESVCIGGLAVTVVDTAGSRETHDRVEREGVARARQARDAADLVLVVLDRSSALEKEDKELLSGTEGRVRIVASNKADLAPSWSRSDAPVREDETVLEVSALTGSGLDSLAGAIARALGSTSVGEAPAIGNARHLRLLERAAGSLRELRGRLEVGRMPEELVLVHLRECRDALEELTGRRTAEDVLEEIFSRFCVGK
jgi:tRNA modification GTPase